MTYDHPFLGPVPWSHGDGNSIILAPEWKYENIHTVHVPQLVGVSTDEGPCSGNVQWNVKGTDAFLAAFQEIEQRGLKGEILTYDGTVAYRTVRGYPNSPSNHAFGTAIDINAGWNGLGVTPPAAGKRGSTRLLVPIFNKWGFTWGGDYRHRKDGMHFEQLHAPVSGDAPKTPHVRVNGEEVPIPCVLINGHAWIGIRALIQTIGGEIVQVNENPFTVTARIGSQDRPSVFQGRNIGGVGYINFLDARIAAGFLFDWQAATVTISIRTK